MEIQKDENSKSIEIVRGIGPNQWNTRVPDGMAMPRVVPQVYDPFAPEGFRTVVPHTFEAFASDEFCSERGEDCLRKWEDVNIKWKLEMSHFFKTQEFSKMIRRRLDQFNIDIEENRAHIDGVLEMMIGETTAADIDWTIPGCELLSTNDKLFGINVDFEVTATRKQW